MLQSMIQQRLIDRVVAQQKTIHTHFDGYATGGLQLGVSGLNVAPSTTFANKDLQKQH